MPTTVVPHKKRGPAPTGKGRQVQVRLQPDLLAAVDAYAIDLGATADDQPMRPEAIRNLIVQALALRKLGRRFILRDAARMREMWAWEETIRNSETWKGKPEGAEAAVPQTLTRSALIQNPLSAAKEFSRFPGFSPLGFAPIA